MLGLLSVGDYNALLYLALNASNPLNVTLVGSSTPVWMLLIGCYFFGLSISQRQGMGAALSILGVLVVLCRGQLELLLQVHLVTGDLYILLASFAWAYNSRMLARPTMKSAPIRADWSAFLLAQVAFSLAWSALFASSEWALGRAHRPHLSGVSALAPAVWWADAPDCFHYAQCRYPANTGTPRGRF